MTARSSQAGLQSLKGLASIQPETRVIVLPSATFELKLNRDNTQSVIGVYATQSATAHAMVGMTFTKDDSPMGWAQGYAMRLQTEINKG